MALWEELIEVLKIELELHKQLKGSIEALKRAIFQRDIDAVSRQIEVQAMYKREIEDAEVVRAGLCQNISDTMGVDASSVSELGRYVPAYMSDEFNVIVDGLREEIDQIKSHTRSIRYVIRTVMHYVEDLLEVYLCDASKDSGQYDCKGVKRRHRAHFTTKLA